jgi:hypothetical protein
VYFCKNPTKTMFENTIEVEKEERKELYGYQKEILIPFLKG